MSLVFAGICPHAPGITGRAHLADPAAKDRLYGAFDQMRYALEATKPDALVVVAAEHFANFFMDNMPAFSIGMADSYQGPIEDPDWLGIPTTMVPGNAELSNRLVDEILQTVDVGYAQEWKFDHGIAVPLNFLTPRYDLAVIPANINCQGPPLTPPHRAWAFGEALRRAAEQVPERIALVGTGGISHWPATPDSVKINQEWDRQILDQWVAGDRQALIANDDVSSYLQGGQGAFEIRTHIAIAGATQGYERTVTYYEPIPMFAVGCALGWAAI